MSDTLEFKSWLIKPGNHRTFQYVRRHLTQFFSHEIEIKSWLDIYHWFEVSLSHTEDAIKWFAPILHDNPPSSSSGATPKQILLYRGAYATKNTKSAPESSRQTQVSYRGQKIQRIDTEEEAKPSNKPRYYRGVIVEEDHKE